MMNKELIDKIIELIDIPNDFGVCEYDDFLREEEDIYNVLQRNDINAEIRFGCTKLVIIPEESDYVIKIPFNGMWYEVYNNETNDYEDDEFIGFYKANDLGEDCVENWDYCENELCKYERAVEDGFGKFFPDTQFYNWKHSYPIYIQKKICKCCADMWGDDFKKVSDNTSKYYAEHSDDFYCLPEDWALAAIEYYGAEMMRKFCEYIQEHHMHRDLHHANLGFDENNAPIVIDWAGYRD